MSTFGTPEHPSDNESSASTATAIAYLQLCFGLLAGFVLAIKGFRDSDWMLTGVGIGLGLESVLVSSLVFIVCGIAQNSSATVKNTALQVEWLEKISRDLPRQAPASNAPKPEQEEFQGSPKLPRGAEPF